MELITAKDLEVRWTRGTAVGPVSFVAPAGRPVALLGPAGSGKSTLLLALAGRMHGTRGALEVAGIDGIRDHEALRLKSSVARLGTYIALEDTLSIEDCLTERTLFDAANPRSRRRHFLQAAGELGLTPVHGVLPFSWDTLVDELTPLQRVQVEVALACIRRAELVVVGDVDANLSLAEQRALWEGFARLSQRGPVVVAGTRESAALPDGVTAVDLATAPEGATPTHALLDAPLEEPDPQDTPRHVVQEASR